MSRDWSGKWPQKSWNWTDENWDSSTDSWAVEEVQPPSIRIPSELRLQSRCHLISRYTYPSTGCPDRIHSLVQLYIAKGFQSSDCYKAIRKLTKEFAASVFKNPLARVPLCVSHTLFQRAFVSSFLAGSCYCYLRHGETPASSFEFLAYVPLCVSHTLFQRAFASCFS